VRCSFLRRPFNYIDRQVFGILAPEMKKIFGWSDVNYTDIVFWFEVAYAIGLLTVGRLLDWIGTRLWVRARNDLLECGVNAACRHGKHRRL
jgi:sugar phosphate permease